MFFPDYSQTGVVYHVINLNDLSKVKAQGIRYDDKATYQDKYKDFHAFLNGYRTERIPPWVDRTKAIFASMNFNDGHIWHSHSMLLAVKIDPSKCWIANENKANGVYEPYILQNIDEFGGAKIFLKNKGQAMVKEYWETSLSFPDNLTQRRDRMASYDAEVMVFHPIEPENIHYIAIVSDHRIMTVEQWKKTFCNS